MRRKYHYAWFVFTDNLCHGRKRIASGATREEALARCPGGYGCIRVEKHRVYDC